MAAVLRGTVVACLSLALVAIAGGIVLGRVPEGMSLAAGLAIGSTNGYLLVATVNRRAPFMAASFFRMALLTGTVVIAAMLLHGAPWAVALGVGAAQMVMTAVGVREGLRS